MQEITLVKASDIPRNGLNDRVNNRIDLIANTLVYLIGQGVINIHNLSGEILDFGPGEGASTHVLKQYGGKVRVVDLSDKLVQEAIRQGIIKSDEAVIADGFDYLDHSVVPDSLDFLACIRSIYFPPQELLNRAERVLKSGGQLLMGKQKEDMDLYDLNSLNQCGQVIEYGIDRNFIFTKP